MTLSSQGQVEGKPSSGGPALRRSSRQAGSWRLERRMNVTAATQVGALIIALLASVAVTTLLILGAKADVGTAFAAMAQGAFSSGPAIIETLVQATPLIFTGLAVAVAFRGGVFNIGAEGQFFAGAMAAYWASTALGSVPPVLAIPLTLVAAALGGAAWGSIAGFLKARYGASEIIVTVMMNFIINLGLSFLLGDLWQEPGSHFFQTAPTPDSVALPQLLAGGRLHLGFILALLVAGLVYVLLWKTTLGYEIRAFGSNPDAARAKGINVPLTTVLIMALSAAIAGLCGASELLGVQHRLRLDISTGFGFTGIIIALLGRLNPVGVIIAAIFFGGLINGGLSMQIVTGVPVALINTIQGLTLMFLLTADVLARYRIRRVHTHG
jgi:simple sugar transport system permease protein